MFGDELARQRRRMNMHGDVARRALHDLQVARAEIAHVQRRMNVKHAHGDPKLQGQIYAATIVEKRALARYRWRRAFADAESEKYNALGLKYHAHYLEEFSI